MIADFIVSVAASVVSSVICGFFAKKAFGKNSDVLTTIYSIYIAFSTFAFSIVLAFVLNDSISNAFVTWSGQNIFTVIKYVSSLFWILFVSVTFVTIIFIIVRQIELSLKLNQKSENKAFKETINYYNSLNKEGDNK